MYRIETAHQLESLIKYLPTIFWIDKGASLLASLFTGFYALNCVLLSLYNFQ